MRSLVLCIAALIVVAAGCSKKPARQDTDESPASARSPAPTPGVLDAPPPEPTPTRPLFDRLLEEAGDEPAFVMWSDSRVVVRTRTRVLGVLYEGSAMGASYSHDLDLVWIATPDVVSVIDLRQPAPTPIPIVSPAADAPVFVVGKTNLSVTGGGAPEYLQIDWAREPKVSLELTFGEVMNPETAAAIERAKLVGGAWLQAQIDRPRRKDQRRYPDARPGKGPTTECDDEDRCGETIDFGASGWELYIARYQCGDYCYSDCLLFDPKTRNVAEPGPQPVWNRDAKELGGSCGTFYFDEAGQAFATGNQLCEIGRGCAEQEGVVLGPLRPGIVVDLGG